MRELEIYISPAIVRKLRDRHNVNEVEVIQCFRNRIGRFATDTRAEHQTDNPTLWFISETNRKRRLKVVFIRYAKDCYVIKSAFPPNVDEERLYGKFSSRG